MKHLCACVALLALSAPAASAQTPPPAPAAPVVRPAPPSLPTWIWRAPDASPAIDLRVFVPELRQFEGWAGPELADTVRFSGRFGYAPQDRPARAGQRAEATTYQSAMNALGRRDYQTAVSRFERVIAGRGDQADAATYWKAVSLVRLGQGREALDTIQTLRVGFPDSRYLADATVLETEAHALAGQPVDPFAVADDEVKLLAIQGLQRLDPEGAFPLLEGVLSETSSFRVKRQALFVVALSEQSRARELLLRYARDRDSPDLQVEAIGYIAMRRDGDQTSDELRAIYESTPDVTVRLAVVGALRSAGDKRGLVTVLADRNAPVTVRRRAVSGLSMLAAPGELWALYQDEPDPELRLHIVEALAARQAVQYLTRIATTEPAAAPRDHAIGFLGTRPITETGELLVDLYTRREERSTRTSIIAALADQDNAEALVTIARQEQSPELRRELIGRLADMAGRSTVAADFLKGIIRR